MNKTEYDFSLYLEALKSRGEISRYEFQGISLRWGRDGKTGESMRYTPDFVVFAKEIFVPLNPETELPEGITFGRDYRIIRMIEIKGKQVIYQQQALARFKGCRSDWPEFEFQMWKKTDTGWTQVL